MVVEKEEVLFADLGGLEITETPQPSAVVTWTPTRSHDRVVAIVARIVGDREALRTKGESTFAPGDIIAIAGVQGLDGEEPYVSNALFEVHSHKSHLLVLKDEPTECFLESELSCFKSLDFDRWPDIRGVRVSVLRATEDGRWWMTVGSRTPLEEFPPPSAVPEK